VFILAQGCSSLGIFVLKISTIHNRDIVESLMKE